jgi:hypothetical protein
MPAILFSAASGGTSGWGIHFALLRPGPGKDLQDLFLGDMSVSNQSRYSFWSDCAISDTPIFVVADYVWGPDESHYTPHRYSISSYVLKPSTLVDDQLYYLEDRYMTVNRYDLEANDDVLTSEKAEIFTRLRRLKAKAASQGPAPR